MTQSGSIVAGPSAPGETGRRRRLIGGQRDTLDRDLCDGMRAWPMWTTLGWHDVRQRYRRSVLGPLWITLSMAILVTTLGIIYSQVFRTDIKTYLPFLCLGFIIWGFISSTATECCIAFTECQSIIKQTKVPFSVHVLRVVWRNFIVFLHTIIIFVPVAVIFGVVPGFSVFLALPGMVLILLNAIWLGFVLAIFSARFHDVPLIVTNLLQIAFFSTPILWQADTLGDFSLMAELNPLYHLLELVRAPLLARSPSLISWLVSLAAIVAGFLAAAALFRRVSRRIVYWL